MLAQRRRKGARTARPTSLVTADKSSLLRIGDARVIAGLSRDEPWRLPSDIDRARYGTVRKDAPDTSDKCLVLSPHTLFPFSLGYRPQSGRRRLINAVSLSGGRVSNFVLSASTAYCATSPK